MQNMYTKIINCIKVQLLHDFIRHIIKIVTSTYLINYRMYSKMRKINVQPIQCLAREGFSKKNSDTVRIFGKAKQWDQDLQAFQAMITITTKKSYIKTPKEHVYDLLERSY